VAASARSAARLAPGHGNDAMHTRLQEYMINQTLTRPVEILLVEDNPGDVRLTREALREGKVRNNLNVVADGVKAMAFLRRQGDYAGAPRPDLILLDLNLPRMSGREVLQEIKADPRLLKGRSSVMAAIRRGFRAICPLWPMIALHR
jgi:CheY-like chemotaxis protein